MPKEWSLFVDETGTCGVDNWAVVGGTLHTDPDCVNRIPSVLYRTFPDAHWPMHATERFSPGGMAVASALSPRTAYWHGAERLAAFATGRGYNAAEWPGRACIAELTRALRATALRDVAVSAGNQAAVRFKDSLRALGDSYVLAAAVPTGSDGSRSQLEAIDACVRRVALLAEQSDSGASLRLVVAAHSSFCRDNGAAFGQTMLADRFGRLPELRGRRITVEVQDDKHRPEPGLLLADFVLFQLFNLGLQPSWEQLRDFVWNRTTLPVEFPLPTITHSAFEPAVSAAMLQQTVPTLPATPAWAREATMITLGALT